MLVRDEYPKVKSDKCNFACVSYSHWFISEAADIQQTPDAVRGLFDQTNILILNVYLIVPMSSLDLDQEHRC